MSVPMTQEEFRARAAAGKTFLEHLAEAVTARMAPDVRRARDADHLGEVERRMREVFDVGLPVNATEVERVLLLRREEVAHAVAAEQFARTLFAGVAGIQPAPRCSPVVGAYRCPARTGAHDLSPLLRQLRGKR